MLRASSLVRLWVWVWVRRRLISLHGAAGSGPVAAEHDVPGQVRRWWIAELGVRRRRHRTAHIDEPTAVDRVPDRRALQQDNRCALGANSLREDEPIFGQVGVQPRAAQ